MNILYLNDYPLEDTLEGVKERKVSLEKIEEII